MFVDGGNVIEPCVFYTDDILLYLRQLTLLEMKKVLTAILFAIVSSFIGIAQPSTFFGLELGKCYSNEEITSTVKNNGLKEGPADVIKETEDNPLGLVSYHFYDIKYGGRQFPLMVAQVLPKDNKLVCVSFAYIRDEGGMSSQKMENVYVSMLDSLKHIYPLEAQDTGSADLVRYYYGSLIGPSVRLDKYISEGAVNVVEVTYLSAYDIAMALFDTVPTCPDIQDTFFGLKMGNKYTHSQIKMAMNSKGSFLEENVGAGENSITFTDVYFAGSKWDFCAFTLSAQNELYIFSCYNSYATYEYEEEAATKKSYQSLKSRLDDKYGEAETKDEDGDLSTIYIGGNDMAIILSKEKSKSKGGTYRYYFKLTYYQSAVGSSQSKADNDEL